MRTPRQLPQSTLHTLRTEVIGCGSTIARKVDPKAKPIKTRRMKEAGTWRRGPNVSGRAFAFTLLAFAAQPAQALDAFASRLISVTDHEAVIDVMVSANACRTLDRFQSGAPPGVKLPPSHVLPAGMVPVTLYQKNAQAAPCPRIPRIARVTATFALPTPDAEAVVIYTVSPEGALDRIEPVRFPRPAS